MTYTEEQFNELSNSFDEAAKRYVKRIEELLAERADMLEALELALPALLDIAMSTDDFADAVAAVRTVIKKARGEE